MVATPILHSIYGKRLGLNVDGVLIQPEVTHKTLALTSATTSTLVPYYGLVTVTSSSTSTYSLQAPLVPGVYKTIVRLSTTTASTDGFTVASGNILSSIGSSGVTLRLSGAGTSVTIVGLSTSQYAVVGSVTGGGGAFTVTT